MIWHTIDQAADVMGVTARTVRKWIANGDLPVKAHQLVPGVVFVDDGDLREAEAKVHARRTTGTSFGRSGEPAGQCG